MPIPELQANGWLPSGHYTATWPEIEMSFSGQPGSQRRMVFERLIAWRDDLRAKNIQGKLILNGSFISNRDDPGDFDTYILYDEASRTILEGDAVARALIDYSVCKARGFDILPFSQSAADAFPQFVHLDAFDRDKRTLEPKGVLEVII